MRFLIFLDWLKDMQCKGNIRSMEYKNNTILIEPIGHIQRFDVILDVESIEPPKTVIATKLFTDAHLTDDPALYPKAIVNAERTGTFYTNSDIKPGKYERLDILVGEYLLRLMDVDLAATTTRNAEGTNFMFITRKWNELRRISI
jgi:hypothetical protein